MVAVALVALTCAYEMEDVPDHMKDRLDRYIALKNEWRGKWISMTDAEKKNYEQVLLSRLDLIPENQNKRLHDKIASLPEEHRQKFLDYLRRRFPLEQQQTEGDEIDVIIKALPEFIRQKIQEVIYVQFQEATAYNLEGEEDELAFPDIPELVDIPEATGYSSNLPEELVQRIDEFLLKREDWKDKWERLSEEKKECFERYIKEHLDQ